VTSARQVSLRGRQRIRVAYGIDSFETGGTEMNAVRTIEHIDRDRFDVRFVSLSTRGPLIERVRAAGVPIAEFEIGSLVGVQAFREGRRLADWMRRESIDVFHAHDIYSNIFGVPWARRAGVPLVIASRRWWTETNRRPHAMLNRLAYRFAHRVLANSESVARLLYEVERVPANKLLVIHNFVDEKAFQAPPATWIESQRAGLGLAAGDEAIGIVANLLPIKDHVTALRAVARVAPSHPRLRLVLVGEGGEQPALAALAESLGIGDRVVFAGRRPNQPSMHWLFRVSLLSSRGEGFPNSLVEAMAAGRPVVATRVGGVSDAVDEDVTGLLVPAGDDASMATALSALLDDPVRAKTLGDAGARRACDRYHVSTVMQVLQETYKDLLHHSD
jgi:L-malate glycosyltransferase